MRDAVQSVLRSDYEPIEVIIVDDGSTGKDARRIIDSLTDDNIDVIQQKNSGVCSARNAGINATWEVKLCTASHDIRLRIMELTIKTIVIGDNAWVAAWTIVLPGVTIGDGAVVAAGAVVPKMWRHGRSLAVTRRSLSKSAK